MSREAIMQRVRTSLGVPVRGEARGRDVAERLANPPRHLIPARAARPHAALVAQFKSYLAAQMAEVIDVAGSDRVPDAVAGALRGANMPQRLRMGADPVLASMPWQHAPGLICETGPAQDADEVGMSRALAGVAETGTLVVAAGAGNPVTLAFMPPVHIIIVAERDIVGPYEDAFARVRHVFGAGAMPRTLNLISGPSRTADIGGRIVIGAHGPRRLIVVVVGDENAGASPA